MEPGFIERLVGIFSRSSLAELEYSENGSRIRMTRASGVSVRLSDEGSEIPAGDASGAAALDQTTPHIVSAGITGTFYRSPAPGQPPFVAVSDLVQDGQTLAILEAMKTLNPIQADRAGRIAEIMQQDGAAVEAGAPLFRIENAE